MSLIYFVEILNAQGDVQTRHKFLQLPIKLGRGYSNDIILDDNNLAAEHAIIESNEDGILCIRDLGSRNAIKIKGKRVTHLHINGDTIAQLGDTRIRVRDNQYQVQNEISEPSNPFNRSWTLLAIALIIISFISLTETWLNDINDSKASNYIMALFPWLISAAVWAAIWALANRVIGGIANFNRHFFILSCGLLTAQFAEYLYRVLGFSLSWEAPLLYEGYIAIAIIAATIYYQLRLISRRKRLMRTICVGAALAFCGLKLLHNYQSTHKYADELYMSETLPPFMRLSRDYTPTEFDQSIIELKEKIDQERTKALEENTHNKTK